MPRNLWIALVTAAAAAAIAAYVFIGDDGEAVTWRTGTVERASLVSAISTSGTLQAVVTVEVGSQVSGQILELAADYNTPVSEGQVIARIDPQTFESRVIQAEAELAVANANVTMQQAALARTQADLATAQANLASSRSRDADASRELVRKENLLQRGVVANREVERARTEAETASAQVNALEAAVRAAEAQGGVARAQIETARAQVQMREAALQQALIDLDRTYIRAPVDGIVIDRMVSVGQTVAASLQSPVLFTIAQDLRLMQVETAVDEADVGQVREGLPVQFTVDAYPDQTFNGRIEQLRRAPTVAQNVVTYTVIVSADNADLRLFPGMTANVEIEVDRRDDILTIPNAAPRFRPEGAGNAPQRASPAGGAGAVATGAGGAGGPGAGGRENFEALRAQLDLSADQAAALEEVEAESRAAIGRLRSQGAAREEFQTEFQLARERFTARLQEILTPEQRTKFAALRQERAQQPEVQTGQVWVAGEDGSAEPQPIRYGLTDGTRTELIESDLVEGDTVIVGQNRPRESARGMFGFRF
jgi:HlyD family secretion protein